MLIDSCTTQNCCVSPLKVTTHLRAGRAAGSILNTLEGRSKTSRPGRRRAPGWCLCAAPETMSSPRAPAPMSTEVPTADAAASSNLVKEELPNDHDKPETHLMLFINGLNGNAGNWDVLIDQLGQYASANEIAILVSTANMSMKTYQGIDRCGERLAQEVGAYVRQHPALQRISVVGHSMGGLIARYALGKMYDPETGLICGLQPAHFISLATPHLGCGAGDSPAQVPLLNVAKIAGKPVQNAVAAATKPFASMFLGASGAQFFLHDSTEGHPPLLVRMTQDIPGDGYYFSAMKAFVTRTAYANIRGDQMVGWANSSLRAPKDLPEVSNVKGKGVVLETPLEDALHPSNRLPSQNEGAACMGGAASTANSGSASMTGTSSRGALGLVAASPLKGGIGTRTMSSGSLVIVDKADPSTEHEARSQPASVSQTAGDLPQEVEEAEEAFEGSEMTMEMLQTLQQLPWRRIDADFSATSMPFFAHNLIQVTRKWLNWEGVASVQHIAALIEEMEEDPRVQHALAAKA